MRPWQTKWGLLNGDILSDTGINNKHIRYQTTHWSMKLLFVIPFLLISCLVWMKPSFIISIYALTHPDVSNSRMCCQHTEYIHLFWSLVKTLIILSHHQLFYEACCCFIYIVTTWWRCFWGGCYPISVNDRCEQSTFISKFGTIIDPIQA